MNRELLDKHFSPDQIKKRQGEYGDVLDYLEGATVIQRLNDAFAAEWSFEIIEHLIQEKEILVLGKLTAQGITKTQFGNKLREESAGDDLKAATTDCIKKCATLFGIGLHLYLNETTVAAVVAPPTVAQAFRSPYPLPVPKTVVVEGVQPEATDNNRVSVKQLAAIFAIAKGKGWSNQDTRDESKQRFGKMPDYLTKREASTFIDSLKEGRR